MSQQVKAIKKESGKLSCMTWFFIESGRQDSNLRPSAPKNPILNLRQTPKDTNESLAYELVLLRFGLV